MKEHSRKAQVIWATISFAFSYMLLALNVEYGLGIANDLILYFVFCIIIIMLPTVITKAIINFSVFYLALSPIIVLALMQIYSPDGFYFIVYKGSFFMSPAEHSDFVFGILISLMMFLMHLLAFGLGGSIRYFINVCTKRKLR